MPRPMPNRRRQELTEVTVMKVMLPLLFSLCMMLKELLLLLALVKLGPLTTVGGTKSGSGLGINAVSVGTSVLEKYEPEPLALF